jgi:hypothetical protein
MKEVKVIWKNRKGSSRTEILVCKKQTTVSFVGHAAMRRRVSAFA